eukprot:jgi/Chrzof1/10196/Cz04g32100.t1
MLILPMIQCCFFPGHQQEVLKRNLGFVEVADGRVSRLHCIISLHWPAADVQPVVLLEDCSSNGTFLNGNKMAKGERVALVEGDRISLVLSVAPLTEQYFIFRAGDPRDPELTGTDEQGWLSLSTAGVYSPAGVNSPGPTSLPVISNPIFRTTTSRYTTAEQSTLEDLKCQICLNTLHKCVALEPCGHNFCATCLSHHLGSQLQSGMQLTCPFRCPPPERIIINYAVRALIELLSNGKPVAGAKSTLASSAVGPSGGRAAFTDGSSNGQPSSSRSTSAASVPAHVAALLAAAPQSSSVPATPSEEFMRMASIQRQSLEQVSSISNNGANGAAMHRTESLDDDFYTQAMSLLCPLDDEHLPMEASNLKNKQVEVALLQLKDHTLNAESHTVSLEALARLAWSDDDVREAIANGTGIKCIVDVMKLHSDNDGIQCNGCLALMSLVRGEGEVCQSNQWHIAKAGAVEVISAAMRSFRNSAMVQLSVLLCFIPLALENAMMQAHITQEALPDIVDALDNHPDEVDIQTKGLVLLGVLIQGDDAVHDAIRQRELEEHVPKRVVNALAAFGSGNDDVLWAALFVLAVLVKDTSAMYGRATVAVARSGLLAVLDDTVSSYKQRHEATAQEPDEMIITAGDYLLKVLQPVVRRLRQQRMLYAASAVMCLAGVVILLWPDSWQWGSRSSKEPLPEVTQQPS